MNLAVNDVRKLSKKFTVLYVEDEEAVRSTVSGILDMLFGNVIIAENGEEGLSLFKKNNPDIVITDIRMPLMDGLEMSKQIRTISTNTPIIITTAFNDETYFLKSIDIGIDKYLIKPITVEPVLSVIYDITKRLTDEQDLKEFKRREIQNKMHKVSQSIVSKIVNSLPNPVITYKNGNMLFVNSPYLELLNSEYIDKPDWDETYTLENMFEQREGFLTKVTDYNENDMSLNRVSIKYKHGHQIFLLHKNIFTLDGEDMPIELFSLNNISLQEYQKNKLKTYTEMLEEFIFKSHYTKSIKVKKETIPAKVEDEQTKAPKLNIDSQKMVSLRKSHDVKTTAADYLLELDIETLQDMQELNELESELDNLLRDSSSSKQVDELYLKIAQKLKSYSQTIQILIEFDDLAFAINSLSELIINEYQNIDDRTHKKLTLFLQNILEDLIAWRQTIFVTQSTIDIHYLDSSLLSAILQVEISLTPGVNEIEDEDEELILF